MNDGKPPILSKTMIFNGIALIVAVAMAFGYGAFEPDSRVPEIAAGLVAVWSIFWPAFNMFLRTVTKVPLKWK